MRIVVALGGNALLKRGEPPDSDIQESHVAGAVLNQAAQTAKRSPEFAATYAAITQRRGKKIATIAISRKLLTRAYAEHHEPRLRGDEQCARQPRRSQKEGARRDDARSHHEREIARMKILVAVAARLKDRACPSAVPVRVIETHLPRTTIACLLPADGPVIQRRA